jgi:hypothetical protein
VCPFACPNLHRRRGHLLAREPVLRRVTPLFLAVVAISPCTQPSCAAPPTLPGEGRRQPGHRLPRLAEDTTTGRSACCKSVFQVFEMFQRYDASVAYGCCKSRSGCFTYCNGYTRMLQMFV